MPTPPIIIKKKGGHGGHHGGAWKVAYADFVTAMMALFIVLWLMNSSQKIQVAVSGYFKDPNGTATKTGSSMTGSGPNLPLKKKEDMAQLKEQLQKSIQSMNDLDKLNKNIEITVTAEGLRIELLESAKGTFFDSGSATLNKTGQEMVELLAVELGKVPNHVSVEGHTDAKPFTGQAQLQQLGTLGRPGERGAAIDATVGIASRSGVASAGLCGSTSAQLKECTGSVEPAHLDYRAVLQQQHRRSGTSCRGQERIGRGESVNGGCEGGI
jgi:outer membrane protein OmpA-like peptidoglycan-associated protein